MHISCLHLFSQVFSRRIFSYAICFFKVDHGIINEKNSFSWRTIKIFNLRTCVARQKEVKQSKFIRFFTPRRRIKLEKCINQKF